MFRSLCDPLDDAVAKEDQIQEEEDEEEEEEEEDIDTKNIFKRKLQHPTWHKEDSTNEANTTMEISQTAEGRVRAGFKKIDGNMQVGPLIVKPISVNLEKYQRDWYLLVSEIHQGYVVHLN